MFKVEKYWKDVIDQKEKIAQYFDEKAIVYWHNTNEKFNVREFVKVNCEYPGEWEGEIKRIERIENLYITVVNVYSSDKKTSLHAVSFIELKNDKIIKIDEYWSEDEEAPEWRRCK